MKKLLFFLFFSIHHISSMTHDKPALFTMLSQRCAALDTLVQTVAHRIQAGSIQVTDSIKTIAWLAHIKNLLHTIETQENHGKAFAAHTILAHALYKALQSKFRESLPLYTTETLLERADKLYDDTVSLPVRIIQNTIFIHALSDVLKKYGINSFHYFYRKITDLAIENPIIARCAVIGSILFCGYHIKKRYLSEITTEDAIINAFSAQTPRELVGLFSNDNAKKIIALGCIAQNIINPRTTGQQIRHYLNLLHNNLLNRPAKRPQFETSFFRQPSTKESTFVPDANFELVQETIDYIVNMDTYNEQGLRLPKTLIFAGASGNGKTATAQHIRDHIQQYKKNGKDCTFTEIPHHEWGINLVDTIKAVIKPNTPHIIFVDEFHIGYGLQINTDKNSLASLLEFVQELNTNNQQVLLICATNHIELIDKALMRDGRFRVITFQNPSYAERMAILENLCKNSAINTENINLKVIAQLTAGCTKSSLTHLFKTAAFRAQKNKEPFEFKHLYNALNTEIRKLRPSSILSAEEHAIIAAHQAGAALTHLLLNPVEQLDAVTTQAYPRKVEEIAHYSVQLEQEAHANDYVLNHGALFTYYTAEKFMPNNDIEQIKKIKVLLGGLEAQKMLLTQETTYAEENTLSAFQAILTLLTQSIPLEKLSQKECEIKREKALQVLKTYQSEVRQLLSAHKKELAALSNELQAKTFLTKEEILSIVEHQKTVAQT